MCDQCNPFTKWTETAERAREMSEDSLRFAIKDCTEAGEMAYNLEKNGYHASKSQGYYHDERSVYSAELRRRGINFR